VIGGKNFCKKHAEFGFEKCTECGSPIKGQYTTYEQGKFHPDCLRCSICKGPLPKKFHNTEDGDLIYEKDFLETLDRCGRCMDYIRSNFIMAEDTHYHSECFVCSNCQRSLRSLGFSMVNSALMCHECSAVEDTSHLRVDRKPPPSHRQDHYLPRKAADLLPDHSPWRRTKPWTQDTYDEIKDNIVSYKLLKQSGISHINVLLVGEVGAGKSSFFNTVNSVFRGYVTSLANAGSLGRSITTQVDVCFLLNIIPLFYQTLFIAGKMKKLASFNCGSVLANA